LRGRELEGQFHVSTVTRGTPSNKRLQRTPLGATMKRRR
jgi:hypothetical protein